MANNEDTEPEEHDSDNEISSPQINVILTGNGMASKFPAKVGTYSTKCLFNSGASHSCVSYRCFKSAYPTEVPNKIDRLSVQNASGKSMAPIRVYEVTVKLGKKNFTHSFIICEELTSAVILRLNFSSRFQIGSDWTPKDTVYLHQGKQKLIEGMNKGDVDDISTPQKRPHLVLKTHVTLPPHTLSVVPVRITNPEVVHSDQYLMSNVVPLFKTQYPDIAHIPLMHHTMDKNLQDLAVCLVNPSEWEVLLPKDKTVQQVQPLTG